MEAPESIEEIVKDLKCVRTYYTYDKLPLLGNKYMLVIRAEMVPPGTQLTLYDYEKKNYWPRRGPHEEPKATLKEGSSYRHGNE